MSLRTLGSGAWIRAMSCEGRAHQLRPMRTGQQEPGLLTCGMTSSQVSMDTERKPSMMAVETSATWPYLNQSVKSRSVSCSALSGERAIDRKKAAGVRRQSARADESDPGESHLGQPARDGRSTLAALSGLARLAIWQSATRPQSWREPRRAKLCTRSGRDSSREGMTGGYPE